MRFGTVVAICVAVLAHAANADQGADQGADQALTLRRVVLSQGGVGYFEYDAAVTGTAALGLDLPVGQVSDALQSLVVLDPAGSVASVTLPSENPLAAAIAALPVPRTALGSPAALLNALQGVTVTVAGAEPMTGRILHAEPPPALPLDVPAVIRGALGKTRVTLLTDAGLRQFLLEDVTAVQVADPALRGRLDAAIAALRGGTETASRHLTVRVAGQGARSVHLGMVLGAPLWKASYRLVLPAPGADKARLQAWAVLENAGLDDWKDVSLTLQSGNPAAFRQAIYRTYYVNRPVVPIDVQAHAAPPADTGSMPMPPAAAPLMRAMAAPAAAAPMAPAAEAARVGQASVLTSFALPAPVSLAAGHSAALPFLDRNVTASATDLLAFDAAHPLAAIRLVNDTGAGLPPGVVTTYDQTEPPGAAEFTGDALMGPVPPGAVRVLSYAQDLATSALWHAGHATTVAGIAAANGVLRVTRRERATTTVDLQAPPDQGRQVVIEVPRDAGTTLATEPPLPVEATRAAWRITVPLQAGEQRRIAAHADRLVSQSTELSGDPAAVVAVLNEQGLPAPARAALQRVAGLVRDAAGRDAGRERLRGEQTRLDQDEARLRANLAAVPAADPLHGQLLRALAADEDSLGRLAAQQQQAAQAATAAHQAVADAIAGLAF